MKSDNPFCDRWKVVNPETGATAIWEFTPQKEVQFLNGEMDCSGILKETYPDWETTTEYNYYPGERKLAVDRSIYLPDGFLDACIEEHYRVERVGDGTLRLYDLEGVEKEPDDYELILELEKM